MVVTLEKKETNYEQSKNKAHYPCTLYENSVHDCMSVTPHPVCVYVSILYDVMWEKPHHPVHVYMSTVYVCTWQIPPPLHVSICTLVLCT